jgi:hypothetical protein
VCRSDVRGNVHGSVRGSVRQCAAVCGSMQQCAAERQGAAGCGSVWQCARMCAAVRVACSVCHECKRQGRKQCEWQAIALRVRQYAAVHAAVCDCQHIFREPSLPTYCIELEKNATVLNTQTIYPSATHSLR